MTGVLREFVVASANPDKAAEIASILAVELPGVVLVPRPAEVPDVEETGRTLLENARLKASALARATRMAAIADDTGLFVDALDGRPGIFAARYAGEEASYKQNVAKLLQELEGTEERAARFATVAITVWPDGQEVTAEGVVQGLILHEPRGIEGFGYDPVFAPDWGDGRSYAEMGAGEKNARSHRALAFRDLAAKLAAAG